LLDPAPCTVQTKGGFAHWNPARVIFTSNYPPESVFGGDAAWLRRIADFGRVIDMTEQPAYVSLFHQPARNLDEEFPPLDVLRQRLQEQKDNPVSTEVTDITRDDVKKSNNNDDDDDEDNVNVVDLTNTDNEEDDNDDDEEEQTSINDNFISNNNMNEDDDFDDKTPSKTPSRNIKRTRSRMDFAESDEEGTNQIIDLFKKSNPHINKDQHTNKKVPWSPQKKYYSHRSNWANENTTQGIDDDDLPKGGTTFKQPQFRKWVPRKY